MAILPAAARALILSFAFSAVPEPASDLAFGGRIRSRRPRLCRRLLPGEVQAPGVAGEAPPGEAGVAAQDRSVRRFALRGGRLDGLRAPPGRQLRPGHVHHARR
ncbi:hypothetical protein NL676_016954 [Syzygium grande]|nr:hypothetical protein NL676_016954 [Syzygium grande]